MNTLTTVLEIIAESIVDRDVNVTNLRDVTKNAFWGAVAQWRQHRTLNRNNPLPCRAMGNSITLCWFSSLSFINEYLAKYSN